MRLLILGASGKTGHHLVTQTLARGDEVVAYLRAPDKLLITDPRLHKIGGQVSDDKALRRALFGCDAVISALGSGNGTLTALAHTLIPAMNETGTKRLVSLVGAGVQMPGDPTSIGRTVMLTLMRLVAAGVLNDATEHARLVLASSLDWTLVRPPRLMQGLPTGKIEHAAQLALGPSASITRADLAAFMLTLVTGDQYVRIAPMVANKN